MPKYLSNSQVGMPSAPSPRPGQKTKMSSQPRNPRLPLQPIPKKHRGKQFNVRSAPIVSIRGAENCSRQERKCVLAAAVGLISLVSTTTLVTTCPARSVVAQPIIPALDTERGKARGRGLYVNCARTRGNRCTCLYRASYTVIAMEGSNYMAVVKK